MTPARAVLVVCVLAASAHAQPAAPLQLAVYAPWAGPADSVARLKLAREIGSQLERAANRPVEAKTYIKIADFQGALAKGGVDFAVVDSAVVARLGASARTIATWSSGTTWSLVSRDAAASIRGKTLALPATDSPASAWLLEQVLLYGELKASAFKQVVSVPVTADAAKAVELGRADLAFVPTASAGKLATVITTAPWPELALVAIGTRNSELWPAAEQATIDATRSLAGHWGKPAPVAPRRLLPERPVLAKPAPLELALPDALGPPPVAPARLDVQAVWIDPEALD